jgi:hypothetical protein
MRHTFTRKLMRGLAVFIVGGLCASFVMAQPPGKKGPKGPPFNAEFRTVTGTVRETTTAPKGEVDGVIFNDGTWVHWPPHLADSFSAVAVKGDKIRVRGYMETSPKGDTRLEVSTLTNLRTQKSVDNPDRPPPADAANDRPVGPGDDGAIIKTGTVREFTNAPKGEVDGLILNDGTWIHWPPHMENRFTGIAKGHKLRVIGFMETGPKGDTKLEVSSIYDFRTNKTIENPDRPAAISGGSAGSVEERLQALEDRLDQLQREIRLLRQKK